MEKTKKNSRKLHLLKLAFIVFFCAAFSAHIAHHIIGDIEHHAAPHSESSEGGCATCAGFTVAALMPFFADVSVTHPKATIRTAFQLETLDSHGSLHFSAPASSRGPPENGSRFLKA
jgi:hypothetical protein